MPLTTENYSKGFLLDEELMAGISPHPERKDTFVAFVIDLSKGQYLGYQSYDNLDLALESLNRIPRNWKYESSSGCEDKGCGSSCGGCSHKHEHGHQGDHSAE